MGERFTRSANGEEQGRRTKLQGLDFIHHLFSAERRSHNRQLDDLLSGGEAIEDINISQTIRAEIQEGMSKVVARRCTSITIFRQ
jgi:hypothetical protein